MKRLFSTLIVSAALCASSFAAAELSDKKRALLDELLAQTGQSAYEVGQQFSDVYTQQMLQYLRASDPGLDDRVVAIVEEEINAIIHQEFVLNKRLSEIIYPIYDKHFTDDELAQMIELNNTELGKKMIRVMPQIAMESMQAGQAVGQSMGPVIQQRLAARFKREGIE